MTTIFNTNQVDLSVQPMFLGEDLGPVRYDQQKYPIFDKLTKQQNEFFWNPEEINLQKDKEDFAQLQDHERHIFTKNISYQILLDSVQERSPLIAFLPLLSLPELESCVVTWSYFEAIHARSYQYLMQNVFPNVTAALDDLLVDQKIRERAHEVTKYYDDLIEYGRAYLLLGPGYHEVKSSGSADVRVFDINKRELKKKLYLCMAAVSALEAIRFYVSFVCSFAFGQLGKMVGNASIIKLIARDEAQHLGITTNILRNWQKKNDDPEMTQIAVECEQELYAIFDKVVQQEKEWASYLFKDGSIIGLNENLLHQYVEYIANKRMKAVGLKGVYSNNHNPFGWLSRWLESEKVQVAPQELEITDYKVAAIKNDIDESSLNEIEL
ncbi:hypothetical protein RsoM2USA_225 [Ralstonia phage RsoM2USA]|nr:hypothetical protein RsoM2USA_225 [Ralstonia phage RsoM2USA]